MSGKVKHNLVVFLNGDQALKVLPQLIDFIPEAKLNLVIYYLRNDEIQEAYDLIKDMEPSTPPGQAGFLVSAAVCRTVLRLLCLSSDASKLSFSLFHFLDY
jgi:hypothetical protein